MSTIDVSAATAALNEAGGVESLMRDESRAVYGEQQTATPTETTTEESATHHSQEQTRDDQGRWAAAKAALEAERAFQAAATEDTSFSGTDLNNLLAGITDPAARAAVENAYKSFQGDYTRKTQQLAESRKQYEQLGPLDSIREAMQVYEQLQDPQSWPQLHSELTQGLQSLGYSFDQASQMAAEEVATQQQAVDPFAALDDPEFEPIKQAYSSLEKQINEMRGQLQNQQAQQQREQLEMALVGELTRQENIIRQSNPSYTDDDINSIYELSSYYDGNLIKAQTRYDAIFNDRLDRYISSKSGVAQQQTAIPGAAVQTKAIPAVPTTLDEAHKQAMEHLRQLELME